MARGCLILSCNKPLLTKNGAPDFRRRFCSTQCKNLDRKEAQEARRKVIKGKRCRLCGHKVSTLPSVSQDNHPHRHVQADLNELHQQELRLRSERVEEETTS